MLVLNGATVLDRALRPLAGVISEICFTDTGSTDGTVEKISQIARDLGINSCCYDWSPKVRPEQYVLDLPETWEYPVPGPFTGLPILRDWAAARNASLALCSGKYVMKLDADDAALTPYNIPATLRHLDSQPQIDFVMCPYEVMDGEKIDILEMYTRIWRNHSMRRFQHVLHEDLEGRYTDGSNWLMTLDGLFFRDWRDSPGIGTRIAHRNFKVLLLEYERCVRTSEPLCPHVVIWLAEESLSVCPTLTLAILLSHKIPDENRAWASVIHGRACEASNRPYDALESYSQAASMGNLNGMLFKGLLQHKMGLLGWDGIVTTALAKARHNSFVGVTRMSDIAKAEALLSGKML